MGSDKTQNIDVRDLTRELPRTVVRNRAKRVLVGIAGGSLLITGVAFAVVPVFPGLPFLLVGLAILATEFHWARRLQAKIKAKIRAKVKRAGRRSGRPR